MSKYEILSLRMYIQKAQQNDGEAPAMGIQKSSSDWEMPNNPGEISIFQLFEKKNAQVIQQNIKKKKVNENTYKQELDKICKNIARETERAQFSSVQLQKVDLCGLGQGYQIHCLTTQDDLTALCLVSSDYTKNFGKKFLSNVILEFREFFSYDPSMYLNLTADMEDWDEGLHFDTLDDIWNQWQEPDKADQLYQMEAQLHQIKDIFLDNLE